jgi:hypothetical protein
VGALLALAGSGLAVLATPFSVRSLLAGFALAAVAVLLLVRPAMLLPRAALLLAGLALVPPAGSWLVPAAVGLCAFASLLLGFEESPVKRGSLALVTLVAAGACALAAVLSPASPEASTLLLPLFLSATALLAGLVAALAPRAGSETP